MIVVRNTTLSASAAPASTRNANANHSGLARPNAARPAPHTAPATSMARPWRETWPTGPDTAAPSRPPTAGAAVSRSEEHTAELQSRLHLVCRLLLAKNQNHSSRTLDFKRLGTIPKNPRASPQN